MTPIKNIVYCFWLWALIAPICCCWGQQSKPFLQYFGINEGMPGHTVYYLTQSSDGYIWLGTDRGVVRYNGMEFENFTKKNGLTDNSIFSIIEDKKGQLYFNTFTNGISCYYQNKFFAHPQNEAVKKCLNNSWVNSWAIDSLNQIWFTVYNISVYRNDAEEAIFCLSQDSLIRYKPEEVPHLIPLTHANSLKIISKDQALLASLVHQANPNKPTTNYLGKSQFLSDSSLLTHTRQLLFKFDKNGNLTDSIRFQSEVLGIYCDKNGVYWVGTSKGLWSFPKGKLKKEARTLFLENVQVSDFLEDREGNFWLSTLTHGLILIKSLNLKSINLPNIKRTFQLNQQLYFQQRDNMIDLKEPTVSTPFYSFFLKNFLNNGVKQTGTIKDAIWFPESKKLWVGHSKGLKAFDNGKIIFNSSDKGYSNWTNRLHLHENEIYIASTKGAFKLDTTDCVIQTIAPSLSDVSVSDITILPNQSIALATEGFGLFFKLPNTDSLVNLTKANGLPSDFVLKLLYHNQHLWIGTNKGVAILNLEDNSFRYLTSSSGLLSNEITGIFRYHGETWITTLEGLSIINDNFWKVPKYKIPIVLKSIFIGDQSMPIQNSYSMYSLGQNIAINFRALTFKDKPIYRYRLVGSEQSDWQEFENPTLQFSNLAPNQYRLEIAARLPNQPWGEAITLLNLQIKPRFVQTLWFWLLLFFVLLGISMLTAYWVITNLYKKKKTELLIDSLRQKALRSQMNPHFLFNTMNSILYLINSDQRKLATKYVAKLSKLMRKVLENSNHNFITLENEITVLKDYLDLEKMRYNNYVDFHLTIHEDLDFDALIPPMLVQPLLENALVHGLANKESAGNLWFAVLPLENSSFKILIQDDGIGREKAQKLAAENILQDKNKSAIGLNSIHQRIHSLNSTYGDFISIHIQDLHPDLEDKGTTITLLINPSNYENSHH